MNAIAGWIRTMRRSRRWMVADALAAGLLGGLLVAVLAAPGCGKDEEGVVTVWCHQGREEENRAMREMVEAFNAAHADRGVRVEIDFFPDFDYKDKLHTAAAAGNLPDVFDLDGPLVAAFVEAGLLQPIGDEFSDEELDDFLRTIVAQGTIDGKLYALGAFDSALVVFYDKQMLADAGVSPPDDHVWDWDEFMDACAKIRESGVRPVAMHMDDAADEWFTYAFSPLVWSAGGALIDEDGVTVDGVLDSPTNADALRRWQEVFNREFALFDPSNDKPFVAGETAMDWRGHWVARSHMKAKGDRLGVMMVPKMGDEAVAPSGSWCWGLSKTARDPDAAMLWIKWVLDREHGIKPIVDANGAIPARKSAFELFPEYERMPYKLFREQLIKYARPRPRTRHYGALTREFAAALRDISVGADPAERLATAADTAQRVIDRKR